MPMSEKSMNPKGGDLTPATSRFTGTIDWVRLDIGDDDHSHLIDADQRLQVVMTRQ